MQATLRILRSLDFAIWQIKSKVLFLANACTSVTSTVRLRSLALTVLHVSSILMVRFSLSRRSRHTLLERTHRTRTARACHTTRTRRDT